MVSGLDPGPNTSKLFVVPTYLSPTIKSCPPPSNLMNGSPPLFVLVLIVTWLCVPELGVYKAAVTSVASEPLLVKFICDPDPWHVY